MPAYEKPPARLVDVYFIAEKIEESRILRHRKASVAGHVGIERGYELLDVYEFLWNPYGLCSEELCASLRHGERRGK